MHHIPKAVPDTNVILSTLWGGKPFQVIELWGKGAIAVVLSQEILDEYFAIFNRFDLTEEDIEDLTILFSNPDRTIFIHPKRKINIIKSDPQDNKFLEAAAEAKADYIVSGDKHLLSIEHFEGIPVFNASRFLKVIKSVK